MNTPLSLCVTAGATLRRTFTVTGLDLTGAVGRFEVAPAAGDTPGFAYTGPPTVNITASTVSLNIPASGTRQLQRLTPPLQFLLDEREVWRWRLILTTSDAARIAIGGGRLTVYRELVVGSLPSWVYTVDSTTITADSTLLTADAH